MKTLLDRLDGLANNMGSAIYEDAETCGEAAAELRRLHEVSQKLQQQLGEAVWNYGEKVRVNQELLEALKNLYTVTYHLGACPGTVEEARVAIAKATGEQA